MNSSSKQNSVKQKQFSNLKDNWPHVYLNNSREHSQISKEQINIIVNNYSYELPLGAAAESKVEGKNISENCSQRLSPAGCNGRLSPLLPIARLYNHNCQYSSTSLITSTGDCPQNVEQSKSSILEEEEEEEEEEEREEGKPYSGSEGGGSIPMAVGILIATVVGTPVFFAAGIKLGLFAGMAGGAMGYTTGKMFADHE